jgi:hypothetical protein
LGGKVVASHTHATWVLVWFLFAGGGNAGYRLM